LYQLHLVKASTARAFVPRDLRLVEAFGYTLGGMFLARYHDSPAGEFDEVRARMHAACSAALPPPSPESSLSSEQDSVRRPTSPLLCACSSW
jgi:hypothetical protein